MLLNRYASRDRDGVAGLMAVRQLLRPEANPVPGQMSDYKVAALMIDASPRAKVMLGDRGYDADWFRTALAERKITACIPSRKNRKVPIPHDTALYRQLHRIEIMFGRLKDWRRIHTRYDRCAYLHVRHRHRRNRHLLDQSMSPEHSDSGAPTDQNAMRDHGQEAGSVPRAQG